MYCRMCSNARQNKYGVIYCSIKATSVGLNQVCNIDRFELDKRVLEEIKEQSDKM